MESIKNTPAPAEDPVTADLSSLPVTFQDVLDAVSRTAAYREVTPVLTSPRLNEKLGLQLFVKAENLQITASFKIRGAANKILLEREKRKIPSILAFSSGNHAQAVAYMGRRLAIATTVIMPSSAPAVKRRATLAWRARLVEYDPRQESRDDVLAKWHRDSPESLFVHPFEDKTVIAGQATVGLEMFEFLKSRQIRPAAVFCPGGGGGLVAGTALVAKTYDPRVAVFVCEPLHYAKIRVSLQSGTRTAIDKKTAPDTIQDALSPPQMGALAFEICQKCVTSPPPVSDEAALEAMGVLFEYFRLVAEPGGAAGLAALLAQLPRWHNQAVLVVVSGGNVEPDLFARAITKTTPATHPPQDAMKR